MSKKLYSKCLELKDLTDFHRDSSKNNGLKPMCRSCWNRRQRAYRRNRRIGHTLNLFPDNSLSRADCGPENLRTKNSNEDATTRSAGPSRWVSWSAPSDAPSVGAAARRSPSSTPITRTTPARSPSNSSAPPATQSPTTTCVTAATATNPCFRHKQEVGSP